jgi:hypothetical protein
MTQDNNWELRINPNPHCKAHPRTHQIYRSTHPVETDAAQRAPYALSTVKAFRWRSLSVDSAGSSESSLYSLPRLVLISTLGTVTSVSDSWQITFSSLQAKSLTEGR